MFKFLLIAGSVRTENQSLAKSGSKTLQNGNANRCRVGVEDLHTAVERVMCEHDSPGAASLTLQQISSARAHRSIGLSCTRCSAGFYQQFRVRRESLYQRHQCGTQNTGRRSDRSDGNLKWRKTRVIELATLL